MESDTSEPTTSTAADLASKGELNDAEDGNADIVKAKIKPGIIFMGSVPPYLSLSRLREIMSRYGSVGRIFLQPEVRVNASGKRERRFVEGWIEFEDKNLAKRVALSLNNCRVGGKRRSRLYECLWNLKYLHRFKWQHLTEQLRYEKAVHDQRMRVEIAQVKREARHFKDAVEKGARLRKLEEKVLKKRGLYEAWLEQQAKDVAKKGKKRKIVEDDSETKTGKKTAKLLSKIMA